MFDRKSERRSAVKPVPIKKNLLFNCNNCYNNIENCKEYYYCSLCNIKFCNRCFTRQDHCRYCDKLLTINITKNGENSSKLEEFIIVKQKKCFCFI